MTENDCVIYTSVCCVGILGLKWLVWESTWGEQAGCWGERWGGANQRAEIFFSSLFTLQCTGMHWMHCNALDISSPAFRMADLNTTECSIRFVSWNVKGSNKATKLNRIMTPFTTFEGQQHLCASGIPRLKRGWVGHLFHSKFNGIHMIQEVKQAIRTDVQKRRC